MSIVVSLVLLATAGAQMVALVRTLRRAVADADDQAELAFRRRQFRRRMQTSAMLAVLAVTLPLGQWLTGVFTSPWFAVAYWLFVMLLVAWLILLAMADIISTRIHYGRRRDRYTIEQARLKAELNKIHREDKEGEL